MSRLSSPAATVGPAAGLACEHTETRGCSEHIMLRLLTDWEARRGRATKLFAQATVGRPRRLGPVTSMALP
eukprot:3166604-Pyramimonas_sp.AAC.1